MRTSVILICILVLAGCSKYSAPDLKSSSSWWFTYNTGSGWTGWHYEMNIDSTGLVTVHEEYGVIQKPERNARYRLPETELDSFKIELALLARIELAERYGFGADKPTDYPVSSIKYFMGHMADSTSIYVPEPGEVPGGLTAILCRIHRIRKTYDGLD